MIKQVQFEKSTYADLPYKILKRVRPKHFVVVLPLVLLLITYIP